MPQKHLTERARQRRAEIAAGALPLFHAKGFHGTSIREIAAAAGLSMGGLYEYISTKDDVLSLVYQEMTSTSFEPLRQHPEGELIDLIARTLLASWDRARDVQILYRETVHIDSSHREELADDERRHAQQIAAAITQGVEAGDLECEDPLLVAHMVLFMAAFMPLRGWITRPDGIESTPEIAHKVAALIVAGLRT
jgi:TetR/AcrR family transcriptional regulator, cholesterol catabolism regulator